MARSVPIRLLYRPMQPAAGEHGDICYSECAPHLQLTPFIYCYWELRTLHPLSADYFYKVVPDGCCDIFFETDSPDQSFIMGLARVYSEFLLSKSFHYVGVRFLPAMLPQLLDVSAGELADNQFSLVDVLPRIAELITRVQPSASAQDRKEALDKIFLPLIDRQQRSADTRLYQALDSILSNSSGDCRVEKIDAGVSARHLRRLFEFYVGQNAKTFSQVVRFQKILHIYSAPMKPRNAFLDAGYYDQAHFIREFKSFYGQTPGQVFAP
jgi:AraC-like DNA-binding protein